jgi:N-methylhydantoinase A
MKRVGVDTGGTFTDLVSFDEDTGRLSRVKVLTDNLSPDRSFLQALAQAQIDPSDVSLLLHGTTIVTNLLIERTGGKVGLITTTGFRDLLDIQLSIRPNPFNYVGWKKPVALVPREWRLEIDERISAQGDVIEHINEEQVREAARSFARQGVDSVAICFLHSFANPVHEERAAEIVAQEFPGTPISLSSQVDSTIREYERTSTTVINSYAHRAVQSYVDRIGNELPIAVRYVHSGGGIVPAETAKRLPLMLAYSGPAAGVLAGVFLAKHIDRTDLITFDMGGTSCDVALITGGRPSMTDSIEVEWNVPARTHSIDVSSVGAGGGSIAWQDSGGALMVGPHSTGARPGPACYGFGGTLPTVTDANLALGLIPDQLLGGQLTLSRKAADDALQTLAEKLETSTTGLAKSIYRVVNATMAFAIRHLTVEKGIDPRDFQLVSFGGAGGQHAVAVADELGMQSVLFPPQASTLSALGMLTADLSISQAQTLFGEFLRIAPRQIAALVKSLEISATKQLDCDVRDASEPESSVLLDLRYIGQSHHVSVPYRVGRDSHQEVIERFEKAHETLYGTRLGDPLELVNVRVVVRRQLPRLQLRNGRAGSRDRAEQQHRWVQLEGESVPILARSDLNKTARPGPLLIEEVDSTYYVPSNWSARIGWASSVVAERQT